MCNLYELSRIAPSGVTATMRAREHQMAWTFRRGRSIVSICDVPVLPLLMIIRVVLRKQKDGELMPNAVLIRPGGKMLLRLLRKR